MSHDQGATLNIAGISNLLVLRLLVILKVLGIRVTNCAFVVNIALWPNEDQSVETKLELVICSFLSWDTGRDT